MKVIVRVQKCPNHVIITNNRHLLGNEKITAFLSVSPTPDN